MMKGGTQKLRTDHNDKFKMLVVSCDYGGFKPDQLTMNDEKTNTKFRTALPKIIIASL